MKTKKQNLLVNAVMLTITALVMGSVGITFRVYISNQIGAEGMGIYKLVSTMYRLFATFAISGISVAVTRIVSEEIGKRAYGNIKAILKKSCLISLGLSTVVCVFALIFSELIGNLYLKDSRTILAFRVIVISLPFISVSSCIKGYFYARRDVVAPITSQILEEFVKITIVVSILSSVLPMGLEYACMAVVLGTTISEVISFIYMMILYQLEKNKWKDAKEETTGLLSRLFYIALPIAGSSYISTGLRTVETMLVPICLIKYGMSGKEAMTVLGGLMGMVMPIMMFPAALLVSIGTILLPEVSRAKSGNNNERVLSLVSRTVGFTVIIGILVITVFNSFSYQLGVAIYKDVNIGNMFKLFSYIVPFMYLSMVSNSTLKGLGEQVSTLKYSIIDSILRIILLYILIPMKGVNGFLITLFISVFFSFILSFNKLIKVTKLKIDIIDWIVIPMLGGTTASLISGLVWIYVSKSEFSMGFNVAIAILIMIFIYGLIVMSLREIIVKQKRI